MVSAIEPAVRLYEAPSQGPDGRDRLGRRLGQCRRLGRGIRHRRTPHNEARDQVWEELLSILNDKLDDDEVSAICSASRRQVRG